MEKRDGKANNYRNYKINFTKQTSSWERHTLQRVTWAVFWNNSFCPGPEREKCLGENKICWLHEPCSPGCWVLVKLLKWYKYPTHSGISAANSRPLFCQRGAVKILHNYSILHLFQQQLLYFPSRFLFEFCSHHSQGWVLLFSSCPESLVQWVAILVSVSCPRPSSLVTSISSPGPH